MRRIVARLGPVLLALAAACGDKEDAHKDLPPVVRPRRPSQVPKGQREWVEFDHIFITFEGNGRYPATRSLEEARALARRIHDWALSGTDWDLLKREYTDDRAPATGKPNGPYILLNYGIRHVAGQIPRAQYSRDIGDHCFSMKVGDIHLVEYDPKTCRSGFHVIKRLR